MVGSRKGFISPKIDAEPDTKNLKAREKIRRRKVKERRQQKLYKDLTIAVEDECWYYEDLFVYLSNLPKIQPAS